MWHTEAVQLSSKSNATALFRLMSIDPIRDDIMYWLSPMDVVEFTIGSGILFSKKDMNKYTDLFKCIIPDRPWLISMLNKGYSFTIIGKKIQRMATSLRYVRYNDYNSSDYFNLILVVTQNGKFIPCDETVIPLDRFMISTGDHVFYSSIINLNTSNETGRYSEITIRRGNKVITLKLLLASCPTESPLFLSSQLDGSILTSQDYHTHISKHMVTYMHANETKSHIVDNVENSANKNVDNYNPGAYLFCITGIRKAYHGFGSVLFYIDK